LKKPVAPNGQPTRAAPASSLATTSPVTAAQFLVHLHTQPLKVLPQSKLLTCSHSSDLTWTRLALDVCVWCAELFVGAPAAARVESFWGVVGVLVFI